RRKIGRKMLKFTRVIDLERRLPGVDDVAFFVRVAELPADKTADQGDGAHDQDLHKAERKELRVDVPFFIPENGTSDE
ncbi:MAG: hypothetical protein SPK71_03385, partial [Prevotella sp.]|nr:hypothetical protein [Prevotella sp.]